MSELVKELRGRKGFSLTAASHFLDELCKAAADRIEALEAQLAGRKAVPVELIDALVTAAVWECDRAVKQALRGERDTEGKLYDTCFKKTFEPILSAYLSEAREGESEKPVDPKWELAVKRTADWLKPKTAPAEKAAGATPALAAQEHPNE